MSDLACTRSSSPPHITFPILQCFKPSPKSITWIYLILYKKMCKVFEILVMSKQIDPLNFNSLFFLQMFTIIFHNNPPPQVNNISIVYKVLLKHSSWTNINIVLFRNFSNVWPGLICIQRKKFHTYSTFTYLFIYYIYLHEIQQSYLLSYFIYRVRQIYGNAHVDLVLE